MTSTIVALGHDVKQEWLDVVVERLVVEEHLGQQAEILTVDLVLASIHLED